MAEITKITTPLVPQENLSNRNKPISDQAFDLTDPSKIHRRDDGSKILNQQQEGQPTLWDSLGKNMAASLLRNASDILQTLHRVTVMLEMGLSTSDIVNKPEVRQLLDSLYLTPERLTQSLVEQDEASVIFKGQAFEMLRDILQKFPEGYRIQNAVTSLLKAYEHNVNADRSVRTILLTCENLLDYLFSGDRAQFAQYLEGLENILMPLPEEAPEAVQVDPDGSHQDQQTQETEPDGAGERGEVMDDGGEGERVPADGTPKDRIAFDERGQEQAPAPVPERQERTLGIEQKEAAQILKTNLLPLLGEIVVKYNQNERIRDLVMVVVHNIVRVDQGTPEMVRDAIARLVAELRLVANLPDGFEEHLNKSIFEARDKARSANNETLSKLTELISKTLSSPDTPPATLRQAENLMLSLLQNQNSMMDVLHFILPMETAQGRLFAEMYVDPDSDEKVSRSHDDTARKIFLVFESDDLGSFELAFVESGERVDFAMWCPELLVKSLNAMKRQFGDIMQLHGYTMNTYQVEELVTPHTIADVFPKLLNRRLGVDVRI